MKKIIDYIKFLGNLNLAKEVIENKIIFIKEFFLFPETRFHITIKNIFTKKKKIFHIL